MSLRSNTMKRAAWLERQITQMKEKTMNIESIIFLAEKIGVSLQEHYKTQPDVFPHISTWVRMGTSHQKPTSRPASLHEALDLLLPGAKDLLLQIISLLMEKHRALYAFAEYFVAHMKNPTVLSAIDALLGCLEDMSVVLEEEFDPEDYDAVVKRWGGEYAVYRACEDQLHSRYRCSYIPLEIRRGSVIAQYELPGRNIWFPIVRGEWTKAEPSPVSLPDHITVVRMRTMVLSKALPSLAAANSLLLGEEPSQKMIARLARLRLEDDGTRRRYFESQQRLLRCMIGPLVIPRILHSLNSSVYRHCSDIELLETYIINNGLDEMKDIGEFAEALGAPPGSGEFAFFQYGYAHCVAVAPDTLPAEWFLQHADCCLSRVNDVAPDSNPKPGQVFKLLTPSRNTPVSAVWWDPLELLGQASLRTKFALDADPVGSADFPLLMYHGTSYNSAKNLIRKPGIDPKHERAKRFRDFGATKSFYLGTDLAKAVEWTEKFLPHDRAIVVYALPPIDRLPANNYDLGSHYTTDAQCRQDWRNLVFRSRTKDTEHALVKQADGSDCIYGPISNCGSDDICLEQVAPLPGTPMQLAVKADHLARFLDDRVVGVLINPPLPPTTGIPIPIPEPTTATHRSTLTDFWPTQNNKKNNKKNRSGKNNKNKSKK